MAKHKVHVLIPYTTKVACGAPHHTEVGLYREQITCRLCRNTPEFLALRNLPKPKR